MPTCESCGGHVTADFVRVFGRGGEVYGCPDCMTNREMQDGDAVAETDGGT